MIKATDAHTRAIAAYHREDMDTAFAEIMRAQKADPKSANIQADAGVILMALGRLEEALVPLERAIKLDPNHADAYYNLGQCFEELGRKEQAMTAFKAAIALNRSLGWRKVRAAIARWFRFGR